MNVDMTSRGCACCQRGAAQIGGMTDRRPPTVIAVTGGSLTPLGRIAHLPGLPSGVAIVRISPRWFQLLIPTITYGPPWTVIVAIKRNQARILNGLGPTTPLWTALREWFGCTDRSERTARRLTGRRSYWLAARTMPPRYT